VITIKVQYKQQPRSKHLYENYYIINEYEQFYSGYIAHTSLSIGYIKVQSYSVKNSLTFNP